MPNRPNNRPTVREHGTPRPPAATAILADGTRWAVPEETPVVLIYHRRNHAVMLATPTDLADFAIGFSLSEGIVRTTDEIETIEIRHAPSGIEIHITLEAARAERLDLIARRRNLPGRAGCGLCGLDNADSLTTPLAPVGETVLDLAPEALARALSGLADRQPLNATTRSVHAAAWADADGTLRLAREDVGRHNALDKLIGALAASEHDRTTGFVLLSSRCSYELVEKAARVGIRALATLSAPTALALRKAQEARLSLHARQAGRLVRVTCDASD